MKVTTLFILILFTLAATAQQKGTPEEIAGKRVDNVKKAVTLSGQQEKELRALFLQTLEKRDVLFANRRDNGESREESEKKFQKVKDEENAGIKKILTPAQYKAYTAHVEKQHREAEQRTKEAAARQGRK
jgi:hypothetical protein